MRTSGRILALVAITACSKDSPPGPVTAVTTTVEVTPTQITLAALGATAQLSVVVKDAQGNILAGKTPTWSSGNAAVASVSTGGLVTSLATRRRPPPYLRCRDDRCVLLGRERVRPDRE